MRWNALLVSASVVACSSPAPSPSPRVPRTVVALGDSITQGTQRELPDIRTPYPDRLRELLGDRWTVTNLGVAGFRARDVRKQWRAKGRSLSASAAVVLAGANDLRVGTPAEDVWSELRPTYEEILGDGMRLVAVTATPLRGWKWDPWTPGKQAELEALNARIARFCAERGCTVVDAYAAVVDPAQPHTLRREYDYGDHLHLSQAGLDRLAQLVADAVVR